MDFLKAGWGKKNESGAPEPTNQTEVTYDEQFKSEFEAASIAL